MRLLACLIVAPQRGYDEPAILSYAISSFCPTSADGLQRRPGLTDDFYQTWRDVGRRGLKEAPEYRNVLLRADRHALWLAGLVRLAAPPVSSPETERTDTLDAPQNAA